jgi:hypothetical protein
MVMVTHSTNINLTFIMPLRRAMRRHAFLPALVAIAATGFAFANPLWSSDNNTPIDCYMPTTCDKSPKKIDSKINGLVSDSTYICDTSKNAGVAAIPIRNTGPLWEHGGEYFKENGVVNPPGVPPPAPNKVKGKIEFCGTVSKLGRFGAPNTPVKEPEYDLLGTPVYQLGPDGQPIHGPDKKPIQNLVPVDCGYFLEDTSCSNA